jgi:hypothetical protein
MWEPCTREMSTGDRGLRGKWYPFCDDKADQSELARRLERGGERFSANFCSKRF